MSKGNKQTLNELISAKGGKPAFNMEEVEEVLPSIEDLPLSVQRRVRALKNNHKEYIELDKKYRDEVAELDRKYQKLSAPLFLKRASIANGEYEPTDAEAHFESEEPAVDDKGNKDEGKDIKGIPEFWLTVMKNNMGVGQTITPEDEPALAHLQDVRYTTMENAKSGFVLTFHFSENPYFTDSVLTKSYFLAEDDNVYGELIFDHAEGTKINWKPGKNLTVKLVKKTQKPTRGARGKKAGQPKVTTVEEPCDSFFLFFNPPQRDTAELNDVDSEEEGMLDDMLEADFEEGCIFKDKLIPHSVLWFTGEAAELEDYDDDYGGFGDFDEDDEDEDDDEDEEEEEEEEERPKKGRAQPPKKGGRGGGGNNPMGLPAPKGGPALPPQPECKQQ